MVLREFGMYGAVGGMFVGGLVGLFSAYFIGALVYTFWCIPYAQSHASTINAGAYLCGWRGLIMGLAILTSFISGFTGLIAGVIYQPRQLSLTIANDTM